MNIKSAATLGLAGNEISKSITGSSDVSPGRTAIATSSGAILGVCASGAVTVTLGALSAPVTIPLAVASGIIAGVASLLD
jgi:predicted ABC-type sugar transport system permease subunit